MYPYTLDPAVANTLTRRLIGERVQEAESQRRTRTVRRQRQAAGHTPRRRPRRWSLVLLRRSFTWAEPLSMRPPIIWHPGKIGTWGEAEFRIPATHSPRQSLIQNRVSQEVVTVNTERHASVSAAHSQSPTSRISIPICSCGQDLDVCLGRHCPRCGMLLKRPSNLATVGLPVGLSSRGWWPVFCDRGGGSRCPGRRGPHRQELVRCGAWTTTSVPTDPQPLHEQVERQRVVSPPCARHRHKRGRTDSVQRGVAGDDSGGHPGALEYDPGLTS